MTMMSTNTETGGSSLGPATAARLAVGMALAALGVAMPGGNWDLASSATGIAALGLALAMLVRGFELRAWFGRGLTLHSRSPCNWSST
jgi:hypothetical protein